MSTRALTPLTVKTRSGIGPFPVYFPEAASQTFKRGEAVYLVSGLVTEFADATDNGSTRFLGFAAEDASGVTGDPVGVWVPTDDMIFEANIYHGTVGSAVTAQSDVGGTLLPLKILAATAGGIVAVDKENTASKIDCCRIIGIPCKPGEAVGDTYGRVEFIVEQAARLIGQ